MQIGIVTKPSVWLYEENHKDVSDELLMGWAVGIFKEENGWLEVVTHYGYTGCLKKEGLLFCTQEELRSRDDSGQMICFSRMCTDIMAQPLVHSEILCTISRGSFAKVLSVRENGYRKIRFAAGQEGYVPCISYTCRKDSDGYLYTQVPRNWFFCQREARCSQKIFRRQLVDSAKRYLGVQYRWGGKSAAGIDCSGLTFMCYMENGILIYRDAKIKESYPVHQIPLEDARAGDLLYFTGHVAMYLGNRRYIHATANENSFGCVINSLCRYDSDYRADLAEKLLMAGSIF